MGWRWRLVLAIVPMVATSSPALAAPSSSVVLSFNAGLKTSPEPRFAPNPEPSAGASPEPSLVPSPQPNPDANPQPNPAPDPEPSPAPNAEPNPEPSPQLRPEASPAPNAEPSLEPSPEPSSEPGMEPSSEPSIDELFEEVFGTPRDRGPQQVMVPILVNNQIRNQGLLILPGGGQTETLVVARDFLTAVENGIRPDIYQALVAATLTDGTLNLRSIRQMGLEVNFDSTRLELQVQVPPELRLLVSRDGKQMFFCF